MQELSGGKDRTMVLCGQDIMDWIRVMGLGGRLHYITLHPITGDNTPYLKHGLWSINKLIRTDDRHLTTYLTHTAYMECQDIRDRIFSVVSLVDWDTHDAMPLLPDYNMTRYRLASELMWRMPELDTKYVSEIVSALDLEEKSIQILEHLRSEGLAHCPGLSAQDTREIWSSVVVSAHIIDLDAQGRFQIVSQLPLTNALKEECDLLFPYDEINHLATSKVVPLYVGGSETLIGFGSGDLHPGDILIFGHALDLILRARSDASAFSIVGGAHVDSSFEKWMRNLVATEICACWLATYSRYTKHELTIAFEASRREVLADQIALCVFDTDDHIESYLERHAIGIVRAGSRVKDVTTAIWPEHRSIGPPEPLCPAHRSSELHRIQGNALWYAVLSGSGEYIRIHDSKYEIHIPVDQNKTEALTIICPVQRVTSPISNLYHLLNGLLRRNDVRQPSNSQRSSNIIASRASMTSTPTIAGSTVVQRDFFDFDSATRVLRSIDRMIGRETQAVKSTCRLFCHSRDSYFCCSKALTRYNAASVPVTWEPQDWEATHRSPMPLDQAPEQIPVTLLHDPCLRCPHGLPSSWSILLH